MIPVYDIKPCPFCGGPGRLERSQRAYIDGESTRVSFVRCLKCNARTSKVKLSDYGKTSHSGEAEREAVRLWNTRV